MSARELSRVEVLSRVRAGTLSVKSAATLLAVFGAAALLLARRRSGVAHMLRGFLGTGGLLLACVPLSHAFKGDSVWTQVATSVHQKVPGLALDYFLGGWDSSGVMMAAFIFLVAIGLLAWPPPRRSAPRPVIETAQRV